MTWMVSGIAALIPGPVQWVKEPTLLQLWHRSQMWLRFGPWPGAFHTPQVQSKKKKKKKIIVEAKIIPQYRVYNIYQSKMREEFSCGTVS